MICNVILYTLTVFAASSLLSVEEFITECNITKKFNHPNILSIIGVSHTPEESVPLMVLPYMLHGDVKSFLTSRRGIRINMTEYPEVRKVPHILENCCDPTIADLTTVGLHQLLCQHNLNSQRHLGKCPNKYRLQER